MPYHEVKTDHTTKVVNTETGKVHAKGTTAARAQAQMNLLRGVEHGFKPTGRPRTTSETMGLHKESKARAKQHKSGKSPGKGHKGGKK